MIFLFKQIKLGLRTVQTNHLVYQRKYVISGFYKGRSLVAIAW